MPPKIRARCDIDLSPGARTTPLSPETRDAVKVWGVLTLVQAPNVRRAAQARKRRLLTAAPAGGKGAALFPIFP
ncbi:hypothetical protein BDI01nite_29080 [Brevundimonas diminuta]|nr:hypothetical protein BDI01nite_29080 [Brevundimonas diminuta]